MAARSGMVFRVKKRSRVGWYGVLKPRRTVSHSDRRFGPSAPLILSSKQMAGRPAWLTANPEHNRVFARR